MCCTLSWGKADCQGHAEVSHGVSLRDPTGATGIDRFPNKHVLLLATMFLYPGFRPLSVCPINRHLLQSAQGRVHFNVGLLPLKIWCFSVFLSSPSFFFFGFRLNCEPSSRRC